MTQPTVHPRGDEPPGPPRARRGRSRATWTVVAVLVLIGVAGTLIVPIYARVTPRLGAFPFFYWYQLLWIPLVAILSWICYLLVRRGGRDSRAEGRRHESR